MTVLLPLGKPTLRVKTVIEVVSERKKQDQFELARARASLYGLVARMVAQEPTESLLKELNGAGFRQAAVGMGLKPPPLPTAQEAEATLEELAAEYARLFLVPGTPLHPFESVQRNEERLWGEATVKVQQAYHEAGFELNPEAHQIPDHLAVELEFMANLAAQEAEQRAKGSKEKAEELQSRQEDFLSHHLGVWSPGFARSLKEESPSPYLFEKELFKGSVSI